MSSVPVGDPTPRVAGDLSPAGIRSRASAVRITRPPPRPAPPEVQATIDAIVLRHRELTFARKTRVAVSNRFAAFVRTRILGVSTFDGKEALAKAARETARIRKALAAGKPLGIPGVDEAREARLRVLAEGVRLAAEPFEAFEAARRKEMEKLAATLPGAGFVLSVRGFGMFSFATLVGEAGDIGSYRTHVTLWKRLGLTCIGGERQQRKAHPLLAEAHGYDPARRAVAYVAADTLFRGQSTDPPGPYRLVYDREKVKALGKGWTLIHAHNHARRVAGKAAIRHLYQAWHRDLRDASSHEITRAQRQAVPAGDHRSGGTGDPIGEDQTYSVRDADHGARVLADPLGGDQPARVRQADQGSGVAADPLGSDHGNSVRDADHRPSVTPEPTGEDHRSGVRDADHEAHVLADPLARDHSTRIPDGDHGTHVAGEPIGGGHELAVRQADRRTAVATDPLGSDHGNSVRVADHRPPDAPDPIARDPRSNAPIGDHTSLVAGEPIGGDHSLPVRDADQKPGVATDPAREPALA